MKNNPLSVIISLIMSALLLTACNLPKTQLSPAPSPTSAVLLPASTPTPTPLCDNLYFPSTKGDTWEYSGTNSAIGAYSRNDTVTSTSNDAFTLETQLAGVTYSVNYSCTTTGLSAGDPVQQYAGALISSPDAPIDVKLGTVSGTTLPAMINPGDTWQQAADFDGSAQNIKMSGRFVFDYTAVGYENISVPAGSFNAFRVDATIRIEVTGLRILAGTYSSSLWLAPDVGIIKSQGASHIPGVDFTDNMELTHFVPSP